jgi:hypothetical protein
MVQSLPEDNGRKLSFLLQSSVLAILGFSPARVFPQGCAALAVATGDLGGHDFPASGCGKLLGLTRVREFWAGEGSVPADGMPS